MERQCSRFTPALFKKEDYGIPCSSYVGGPRDHTDNFAVALLYLHVQLCALVSHS